MKVTVGKLGALLLENLNSLNSRSHKADFDIENIKKDAMISKIESKESSTSLALERFRKEAEKKEAAAESAKARCKICFKETAPTPRCFGHGGGGGGGEGTGSSNTSKEKTCEGDAKSLIRTYQSVGDNEDLSGAFGLIEGNEGAGTESQLDKESYDPEVIAELVIKGLLIVSTDRESLTLGITLQCAPNSLSREQKEELKKFISAIIREFDAFKEQHQLSNDCINLIQDEEGNILSLRISLPTLKLYNEFIQELANNLLPPQNQKLQTKEEQSESKNSVPTPLSMKPKLSVKSTPNVQDEIIQNKERNEALELFNPSPFSKMNPW
ncbi:hypothetical protein Lsai_1957 [Legionella sainthelensi]|uniref:Uncharacterized protein n=1 Tax=Legionella sainthelensi TaxID=28087 RepID=A0A0W0YH87_9GAMM|nr:hypothetical protein [Legionella sainthelensi]KTD56240.1 hypothetical protein Lsai_1957 [Legionella sainthelensi]VEH31848.1 Uncharacterised protein [Legionella sainthelensi]